MLTGDNPLTACHVAKELKISQRKLLVLTRTEDEWVWQSVGGGTTAAMDREPSELGKKYDLCITGEVRSVRCSLLKQLEGALACINYFLLDLGNGVLAEGGWGEGVHHHTTLREGLCKSCS